MFKFCVCVIVRFLRIFTLQNGRSAFGHKLIKQPLMRNLLADLCVESEAHTLNAMYMARAFDQFYTSGSEQEKELFRIGVSVSKYFVTKRLPGTDCTFCL